MDIADLSVGGAIAFADGFFCAFDQSGIGQEVADLFKAFDLVDLIKRH